MIIFIAGLVWCGVGFYMGWSEEHGHTFDWSQDGAGLLGILFGPILFPMVLFFIIGGQIKRPIAKRRKDREARRSKLPEDTILRDYV